MEVWKDVVGFEDIFQVSSFGNVYSKRTNKNLKQCLTKSGYKTVATKIGGRNGVNHTFRVHRLVAIAFLGYCDGRVEVNHIDGNKANNKLSNLEWVTPLENMKHAKDTGLIKPPKHRLSDEVKDSVYKMFCTKKYTYRQIADMFGLHYKTVGRIVRSHRNAVVV